MGDFNAQVGIRQCKEEHGVRKLWLRQKEQKWPKTG